MEREDYEQFLAILRFAGTLENDVAFEDIIDNSIATELYGG